MDRSNDPYKQFQRDQGAPEPRSYNPGAPAPSYNPGSQYGKQGYNPAPSGYNPPPPSGMSHITAGTSKIGMSRVSKIEAPGNYNPNNDMSSNRQVTNPDYMGGSRHQYGNQNPPHYQPPPQNYNSQKVGYCPTSGYNNPPYNPHGGGPPNPGNQNVQNNLGTHMFNMAQPNPGNQNVQDNLGTHMFNMAQPKQPYQHQNTNYQPPNQGYQPPNQGYHPPNQGYHPPNQTNPGEYMNQAANFLGNNHNQQRGNQSPRIPEPVQNNTPTTGSRNSQNHGANVGQSYREYVAPSNHKIGNYGQSGRDWNKIAIQTFLETDRDHSGEIEMIEFPDQISTLFRKLGLGQPDLRDCFFLMKHFDTDGNGKIDMDEYIGMIQYMQKVNTGN